MARREGAWFGSWRVFDVDPIPLGRWRKSRPFACPRARCLMCHSEKRFKVPRARDLRRMGGRLELVG
jgi:hypothetical protein